MHIVQIGAELSPIAKVGGLGDVLQGLSESLIKKGHRVDVILPKYSFLTKKNIPSLEKLQTIPLHLAGEKSTHTIFQAKMGKLTLYLVEPHEDFPYFKGKNIYGYKEDPERFVTFCHIAMAFLHQRNKTIDVLHIHDWHTAICPLLYNTFYKKEKEWIKRGILLTISNLSYQGQCSSYPFQLIGLFSKEDIDPYVEKKGWLQTRYNLLKGGIDLANSITIVSPTYAKEIFQKNNSCGLLKTLRKNRKKISGILNGIDTDFFDPANDPFISFPYSANDRIEMIQHAKKENKKELYTLLGIRASLEKPLICSITRLVHQKAPELIIDGIRYSEKKGCPFILLGSSPIKKMQKRFEKLASSYQHNPEISLQLTFSESLAHKIYAASDFCLIPSHFEPCGLTQLIAMRYGTLPIVRKVGGLNDTVFDADDDSIPEKKKNGFSFKAPTKKALENTLLRARKTFFENPKKIRSLMKKAIRSQHSWEEAVQKYIDLYKKL